MPKDIETQVNILKSPVILLPTFKRFIENSLKKQKTIDIKIGIEILL